MTKPARASRNTGRTAEDEFDDRFAKFGKRAWVYKFEDQTALHGLNKGKVVKSAAKPCDRIVVIDGKQFFAEIKSSTSQTRFSFSNIRKSQLAFCKAILAAGGDYRFFIRDMTRGDWYQVMGSQMLEWIAAGSKSASWGLLKEKSSWLM